MITRRWTYREGRDADAPATALFLFGEEFLTLHPNREVVILGTAAPTRFPVDEIICDSCSAVVDSHEPCVLSQERLYCWPCAQRWIVPYLDAVVAKAEGR